jgi:hypothetical protein
LVERYGRDVRIVSALTSDPVTHVANRADLGCPSYSGCLRLLAEISARSRDVPWNATALRTASRALFLLLFCFVSNIL